MSNDGSITTSKIDVTTQGKVGRLNLVAENYKHERIEVKSNSQDTFRSENYHQLIQDEICSQLAKNINADEEYEILVAKNDEVASEIDVEPKDYKAQNKKNQNTESTGEEQQTKTCTIKMEQNERHTPVHEYAHYKVNAFYAGLTASSPALEMTLTNCSLNNYYSRSEHALHDRDFHSTIFCISHVSNKYNMNKRVNRISEAPMKVCLNRKPVGEHLALQEEDFIRINFSDFDREAGNFSSTDGCLIEIPASKHCVDFFFNN